MSACASFIAYSNSNAISKPRKRIEGFRSKWVMVDVGRLHPRLVLPTGQPKAVDAWSRTELVDPRAKAVLKRMNADLRPGNLGAAKQTGSTLLREFLEHRVAPLQEHSLPLWRLGEVNAPKLRGTDRRGSGRGPPLLGWGRRGEPGGHPRPPIPS